MDLRYSISPKEAKRMETNELRNEFLVDGLFSQDEIHMTYSFDDRMIIGGIVPVSKVLELTGEPLASEHFLDMREIGVYNLGGPGDISVDGTSYKLGQGDLLYIGMGMKELKFSSESSKHTARFYFVSVPAHRNCPTRLIKKSEAVRVELGEQKSVNKRTIFQYVHPKVTDSCQLLMGVTSLEEANVWNTMPTHTHVRRMETYFYFDMSEDDVLMHFMGTADETKHIVVRNEEAVISPSWSVHSGVGTSSYSFLWGMAGENKEFGDMQVIDMKDLK